MAEYPDRETPGYHLPRLIVPNVDLGQLVRASRQTSGAAQQAFFNKDLGEEFAPEDASLGMQFIEAAQRDYVCPPAYAGDSLVTAGIDVSNVRGLHVRVSEHSEGRKRALFLGEVDHFEALDELMERYEVWMAAIDAQPERRLARAFAERHAGRVYLVSYATSPNAQSFAVDESERRITVARVDLIDETLELIRRQRNLAADPPGRLRESSAGGCAYGQ